MKTTTALGSVPVGSQVYWEGERWQVLEGCELASLENCREATVADTALVVVIEEVGQ